MSRFGQFEAVSLVAQSAHTSVWLARPAADLGGAAEADHVVKRVTVPPDEEDPGLPAARAAADRLLAAAAVQQAMGFKSVGWAPVYDAGTAGADAYYVAERFPRSAQSLVDADRRVTAAELRAVLMAVVDALIELQVAFDRPHANLKPSNVLIGRQIKAGMVCLTDPAAVGEYVPSLTRAPDPRAIGRMLFALVTGRPHTAAPWPLVYDDRWRALGEAGPEWFALCQLLMHPRAAVSPDLDELMTRIVAIRPSWRRVRRAIKATAVVVLVGLAAYAARGPLWRWGSAADRQVRAWVDPPSPPARHRSPPRPTPFGRPAVPLPPPVAPE